MKKVFLSLLALLAAISLFACEQQKEMLGDSQAEDKGAKTVKVGVCIYKFNDAYMRLYREEIERYTKLKNNEEVHYELAIVDGKDSKEEQMKQVEDFVAKKYDVILVNLVEPADTADILKMCRDAKIPLLFIGREPKENDFVGSNTGDYAGKVAYVGADARQVGKLQGEIIAELEDKGDINGDGKLQYVMIKGKAGDEDTRYRTALAISQYKEKSGLEVEKLYEEEGSWERGKGERIAKEALEKYGKQIEVIFCNDDDMAMGAKSAIDGAGRKVGKDIYLVGAGATAEAVQIVMDGNMTGTVSNDYVGQAHKAIDYAISLVNGDKVPLYSWVDYTKVTQ